MTIDELSDLIVEMHWPAVKEASAAKLTSGMGKLLSKKTRQEGAKQLSDLMREQPGLAVGGIAGTALFGNQVVDKLKGNGQKNVYVTKI